jgi:hypothetical protein
VRPNRESGSVETPEHPVPKPSGEQQLPAELAWTLVPAVYAHAILAEQTLTEAVAGAMPAVSNLGHTNSSRTAQVAGHGLEESLPNYPSFRGGDARSQHDLASPGWSRSKIARETQAARPAATAS